MLLKLAGVNSVLWLLLIEWPLKLPGISDMVECTFNSELFNLCCDWQLSGSGIRNMLKASLKEVFIYLRLSVMSHLCLGNAANFFYYMEAHRAIFRLTCHFPCLLLNPPDYTLETGYFGRIRLFAQTILQCWIPFSAREAGLKVISKLNL